MGLAGGLAGMARALGSAVASGAAAGLRHAADGQGCDPAHRRRQPVLQVARRERTGRLRRHGLRPAPAIRQWRLSHPGFGAGRTRRTLGPHLPGDEGAGDPALHHHLRLDAQLRDAGALPQLCQQAGILLSFPQQRRPGRGVSHHRRPSQQPAHHGMTLSFRIPGIRRDDRGVAAIEFAFVAPVLFLFLIGTIELTMVLFLNSALERGVLAASRYAITGSVPDGVSRQDRVLDILKENTFGLITLTEDNVTALIYPTFDSIGQPEPFTDLNGNGVYDEGEPFVDVNGNGVWDADMGLAGLGGPGDIVVYRVDYDWGMLTQLLDTLVGGVTLTGSIVVRNEPF
ncbi:MAG: pilus assembly protein [Rhodospirillales bacterium]|nr:MAG: pilus assembly protein [Rhodospirillales bacterium]